MDKIKKKKKVMSVQQEEETSQQGIGSLGQLIFETAQGMDKDQLDVFEKYAHVLMLKIFSKEELFCERLTKGYEVLLQELTEKRLTGNR